MTTTLAKSVLIVDDSAVIRQGLCELFKRESDFEVCGEAENGKQAIEKAQKLRPDLIVLDLSMPVMNGFDAARALKRLMPMVHSVTDLRSTKPGSLEFPKWSRNLSTRLC